MRILIADDHAIVLEGLVAMLGRQTDMSVVAEATNGVDAVELWLAHRPDVALIDLRMPRLDGVGVIEAIRRHHPGARIIVLTTYDTDEEVYQAMKAGARGYLLKDARREELLEVLRAVHAGEMRMPAALADRLARRISSDALTARELEVLASIARGQSNKEIGAELSISETTVKSHLKSIFEKLGATSRTDAVTAALRRGLISIVH
ncbi:MAG TPA: response regulator transcription factor [Gemmatimonadaceae bacterium]|jgi:DNA-binding NarL/FixJ family response regulator|nr:response regulator transcription factor [Gemmatimonadaceae bacterium]